jgi:hypothetical protein
MIQNLLVRHTKSRLPPEYLATEVKKRIDVDNGGSINKEELEKLKR